VWCDDRRGLGVGAFKAFPLDDLLPCMTRTFVADYGTMPPVRDVDSFVKAATPFGLLLVTTVAERVEQWLSALASAGLRPVLITTAQRVPPP
jgi:hypothetical protein